MKRLKSMFEVFTGLASIFGSTTELKAEQVDLRGSMLPTISGKYRKPQRLEGMNWERERKRKKNRRKMYKRSRIANRLNAKN